MTHKLTFLAMGCLLLGESFQTMAQIKLLWESPAGLRAVGALQEAGSSGPQIFYIGISKSEERFYDANNFSLLYTTSFEPAPQVDTPRVMYRINDINANGHPEMLVFRLFSEGPGGAIADLFSQQIIFFLQAGGDTSYTFSFVGRTSASDTIKLGVVRHNSTTGTNSLLVYSLGITGVTEAGDFRESRPMKSQLEQNYPNPFNPTTTIEYEVQAKSRVTIRIYDLLGKVVRTLVDQEQSPGTYSTIWDGKTDAGVAASSGTYFYQCQAGESLANKKMILIR